MRCCGIKSPCSPCLRVNRVKGVGSWIFKVIRYPVVKIMAVMTMVIYDEPVKIVEDKEPRKD